MALNTFVFAFYLHIELDGSLDIDASAINGGHCYIRLSKVARNTKLFNKSF